MERLTLTFAGRELPFADGDTVLDALLRNDVQVGAPLCTTGDCPNCLATIDGVSYVRTCQTPADAAGDVMLHGPAEAPPLPSPDVAPAAPVTIRHRTADVVVIGGGRTGAAAAEQRREAGEEVVVVDTGDGAEAIGVYAGPRVVIRTDGGLESIDCDEVVVATGSVEIQPIVPGSDLPGVVTPRAAARMRTREVDLGVVVDVGPEVVRFEGDGRLQHVVVSVDGSERRIAADTAVVDLGRYPRDALLRMGAGLAVSGIGSVTEEATLPRCPESGVVCPCAGVTIGQLDDVWDRGFREMELVKRSTLAGTGTCQGSVCIPYLRAHLAERGPGPQPAFTARPVARQVTMAEAGAGEHLPASPRTALDDLHRELGATMDRIGGWWRPWTYGDSDDEYAAVRSAVSLGDVSTLGKMLLTGPDAEAAVQRLYPTDVTTIRQGRCRYALMLDERGYVFDDGMICRLEDGFLLTFTTGGATMAEMWVRDWVDSWGFDVRILNQTFMLGAINVTGPAAGPLLERAGATDLPRFLGHATAEVAGVPCTIMRLGFTGEVSYELHHPVGRSVELWQTLMDLGADLDIRPHGLDALTRLRLDKGHILVGQDTDYDSTPRRLDHAWAVSMDSGDFIGRHALTRTDRIPLDRMLVGFTTEGEAPLEGAVIWNDDDYAGYVTSAAWSPTVGKGVALGWLDLVGGELPRRVRIESLEATRVDLPFYDPEGRRSRA
jgi:glycine cleavage system aminomethyltransferase T